jgi:hypothetical protein
MGENHQYKGFKFWVAPVMGKFTPFLGKWEGEAYKDDTTLGVDWADTKEEAIQKIKKLIDKYWEDKGGYYYVGN